MATGDGIYSKSFFPLSSLVKIATVYPPQGGALPDFVIWDSSSNGNFSAKLAYTSIEGENGLKRIISGK